MNSLNIKSAQLDRQDLEKRVKQMYRQVALEPGNAYHFEMGRPLAERLGYPIDYLDQIPAEAIESFAGVGYFFHLAKPKPGEAIVDLGSGSGMDVFYAAQCTGPSGQVTGIDMTDEQLQKATLLKRQGNWAQVDFRKAYIESLPLKDNSTDLVISNGVINLSPDKEQVFKEVARILKPGGRLALADIVSIEPLPLKITCNAALWASCIGGALRATTYTALVQAAGLQVVLMENNSNYAFISDNAIGATKKYGIKSVSLLAYKK